ncbi:MAG: hypothetical protein RL228_789 [Actinomycetota bacterium]|jgi:hypothetical protein
MPQGFLAHFDKIQFALTHRYRDILEVRTNFSRKSVAMTQRGRHRAPGRHARPKNRQAPLTAISLTAVLVFGISFSENGYAVETSPVAVDAKAMYQDEKTFIDVKELAPSSKNVISEEVIPFEVTATQDPNIAAGTRIVKQKGEAGTGVIVYAVKELNGVEVTRTEVSRSVNREPIPEVVVEGTGDPVAIRNAEILAGINIQTIADAKKFTELYISSTYGWGSEQFVCIDLLFEKESNWRVSADNPNSSAYGIPQALPGSRMAEIADDWRTNPVTQIKWGAQYIEKRYGSPCAAWNKASTVGWY